VNASEDAWDHTRPFALMTQHAQIAERKYCRAHARPFRLRFARVVSVLPVCSPAALNIQLNLRGHVRVRGRLSRVQIRIGCSRLSCSTRVYGRARGGRLVVSEAQRDRDRLHNEADFELDLGVSFFRFHRAVRRVRTPPYRNRTSGDDERKRPRAP
jgi:hypothetical protein